VGREEGSGVVGSGRGSGRAGERESGKEGKEGKGDKLTLSELTDPLACVLSGPCRSAGSDNATERHSSGADGQRGTDIHLPAPQQ